MFLVAQTCQHAYEPVDGRPLHEARKCTACGQHEYWSEIVKLWLDQGGMPCAAERGPVPPKAA